MDYTKEEIEEMDPLSTYYESRKRIAEKQNEFLGDLDLKNLQSQLGGNSTRSQVQEENEEEEVQEEEVNNDYFIKHTG